MLNDSGSPELAITSQIITARKHVGAFTPEGHGYVRPSWATHPAQTPAARMAWQADRMASLSFPKGDRA